MVNITANMTQVLVNSPQVTALVAGEAGALEHIKRQNQIEESRRLKEEQRSRVLSAEKSLRPDDPLEDRRQTVTERDDRQPRRRTAISRREQEGEPVSSASSSTSFFEVQAVIDRCV